MTSFPRTAAQLRAALASEDYRPRKRHGQCFLTDPQAVDAIVRDAGVAAADHVVEVGTGVGLLTHALAETGARITSFEIDADALALARRLRDWPETVVFVEGDVLEGKHRLSPRARAAFADRPAAPGRLLFVSNLPYGAGTPIVLDVLALPRPPDDVVVMLQREVAEKMLAGPGSKAYGAPSVLVGMKANGRILRRFGPQVFWPRPKVSSAVVRLTPRPGVPLAPEEHDPFGRFVTALFSHRRKVLPSALGLAGATGAAEAVRAVGLDEKVRVQDVEPLVLLELWRRTLDLR